MRHAVAQVDVQLPELDLAQAAPTAYAGAVNSCLAVARCTGITLWGIRDSDSWRTGENPLLFDSNGTRKPAYGAVLTALINAVGGRALETPGHRTANGTAVRIRDSWGAANQHRTFK
ncbi:endo-1,4-beta-xylanase [Kitasatospora sp. NPDC088134]|uniref:endo-1,4-beta-xylanase n=1 Tax=Kitasatospora sp. NPDC088134 TaxID=3364071 RepID=UPI0037FF8434